MTSQRIGWPQVVARGQGEGSVLVVEDEGAVRQSLERLVERFGYAVKAAAGARAAVPAAATGQAAAMVTVAAGTTMAPERAAAALTLTTRSRSSNFRPDVLHR